MKDSSNFGRKISVRNKMKAKSTKIGGKKLQLKKHVQRNRNIPKN